ncbi:hypothetical protein [Rufibacter tibetensis]|uniref:Uncharacterized protein n=1 Tax=Rufibacter tibetensis TaxID=512763 RepID=A0A0P0CZN5_9BACT|nr:hypothetical protein [Rufibacter tibetensis]ALI99999.1 hypothetical protein DC20_14720 [Rufibacter tibetensis]
MQFLKQVHLHQAKKILVDSSQRGDSAPQDLLWLTHQVVPILCDEEVQQLALVVPHNPHHARNLESCLMTSEVCYDLQFFHASADALDWLRCYAGTFKGRSVA